MRHFLSQRPATVRPAAPAPPGYRDPARIGPLRAGEPYSRQRRAGRLKGTIGAALAVAALLTLSVGGAARAQPAADDGVAALTLFIDTVRGYDVTTIRRTFPEYNQGLFEQVFGAGEPIPLATPAQRVLFTEQNVRTPAGHLLDIGHVITGLEAATALSPSAARVERATGCRMLGSVTWSGDVGKALHDSIAEGRANGPDFYFEREAPDVDLLGNIDGWVLGIESGGAAVDVAALLERSYFGGDLESNRFRRFAASIGGADGQRLGPAARDFVATEITCFAGALAQLTRSGVPADAIVAEAPYFVERFIRYVDDGLAGEPAG